MGSTEIIIERPKVEDYCRLRQACGWPVPATPVCERALNNSLMGAIAVKEGQTIGMGRVVGDGVLWNYIQDLIVLPAYQRQGIGRLLLNAMMARLAQEAAPGSDVALISAPQAIRFYETHGFAMCSPDKPGMRRKL